MNRYLPYGIDLSRDYYFYKNVGWWDEVSFNAEFNNRKFKRWNYLRKVKAYERARAYVINSAKDFSKITDDDGVYRNAVDDKFLVYLAACRTDEFDNKVRHHDVIMRMTTYNDWKEYVARQIKSIKGSKNQENFLFYLECKLQSVDFSNAYYGVIVALVMGVITIGFSNLLQLNADNGSLFPVLLYPIISFLLLFVFTLPVCFSNRKKFLQDYIKISEEYFEQMNKRAEELQMSTD